MEGQQAASSNGSFIVKLVILLAILGVVAMYVNQLVEHSDNNAAQIKQRKVASDASRVANEMVKSMKACKTIGAVDLDSCSKFDAELDQEVVARKDAETAAIDRNEFLRSCQGLRTQQECSDLLTRAINLAAREAQNSK